MTLPKTMKPKSRVMLDKWAAHIAERRSIIEFWAWLETHNQNSTVLGESDIERLLDEYHGIDQKRLEVERRELLESLNRS